MLGLIADGGDFLVLASCRDDDDAGAGVGQHSGDLLGGEGGVEGHIDGAEGEDGEIGDRPLPAIFGEDGDAVALADAPSGERGGEGANAAVELVAGDGLPLAGGIAPLQGAFGAGSAGAEEYVVYGFEVEFHSMLLISDRHVRFWRSSRFPRKIWREVFAAMLLEFQ